MPKHGPYTSVDKEKLQWAFALASHAGEDDAIPKDTRDKFRAIARYIWQAHDEHGHEAPKGVGKSLLDSLTAARFPHA